MNNGIIPISKKVHVFLDTLYTFCFGYRCPNIFGEMGLIIVTNVKIRVHIKHVISTVQYLFYHVDPFQTDILLN